MYSHPQGGRDVFPLPVHAESKQANEPFVFVQQFAEVIDQFDYRRIGYGWLFRNGQRFQAHGLRASRPCPIEAARNAACVLCNIGGKQMLRRVAQAQRRVTTQPRSKQKQRILQRILTLAGGKLPQLIHLNAEIPGVAGYLADQRLAVRMTGLTQVAELDAKLINGAKSIWLRTSANAKRWRFHGLFPELRGVWNVTRGAPLRSAPPTNDWHG